MLGNVGCGWPVPTGPNFPTKLWLGVAGTAFLFNLMNLCFGVVKKFDKGKCKSHNLELLFGTNPGLQIFSQSGSLSGSFRGKLVKGMRFFINALNVEYLIKTNRWNFKSLILRSLYFEEQFKAAQFDIFFTFYSLKPLILNYISRGIHNTFSKRLFWFLSYGKHCESLRLFLREF